MSPHKRIRLCAQILAIILTMCACKANDTADSTTAPLVTETVVTEAIAEESTAVTEPSDPFQNYCYRYEDGRNRNWEEDVVYLAKTFLEEHPRINDTYYFEVRNYKENDVSYLVNENEFYDEALRNTFLNEIDLLIAAIPELEDIGIQYELQRIVALLDDAHSNVILSFGEYFPIMFTKLENEGEFGYYTVRVPVEHKSLLYSQLISINGVPLEDIIDLLRPYISSENAEFEDFSIYDRFWNSLLMQKDILKHIGVVTEHADSAEFAFILEDGSATVVTLDAITSEEYNASKMACEDHYARRITQWAYPEQNYWFELNSDKGLLYARISKCSEVNGYAFQRFCGEILNALADREEPVKLVIDLRGNTGGQYPMSGFEGFVKQLGKFHTNGFYILIDNGVFSSGNAIAAKLSEFIPDAVLVGTPTGQPINIWGNPYYYTMPNSQIRFRQTKEYWKFAETMETDALMPDITVYQTLNDYKQGVDTVFEFVNGIEK